jgi:PD-(D/E)XK nuclease superfamily/Exodeoxyribonuclease V, gamma subunit
VDLHLYPTVLSRDCALRQATRQRGVLFDHRHFTYPELCEQLYRSDGLPGRLIDNPAQTVFVRHSITALLGEAPSPGLVAEYRGLFDELKGIGLDVAAFGRSVALIAPEVPEQVRATLQTALAVWEQYQACLERAGLVDHGDRDLAVLAHLRHHLVAGMKPTMLRDVRRVVVHDVYHLSLVYYALVSLLIKLLEDGGVLQHFSSSANVDATGFAEYTWQRFVADESLANLVLPEFARPRERGGNLEALSQRLFATAPRAELLEPDASLEVIAAPGRRREVEIIARRVRELLAQGVAPEEIAIVVRHLDQYGDLLESVCRRYRVPLWFRRGVPLFHVPLTKTLFSLLELAGSTYPRQALLRVLTSSYLRPDGAWPDDVVGMINAVGYLDRPHMPLPTLLEASLHRQPTAVEEVRKIAALSEWVEALQMMLDGFVDASRSFLAYLERLKALLLQLGFFRAMGMQSEVPLHVVQRDREALRSIFDTLWIGAEAFRLLGDAPLTFSQFYLLAIDLLREVTLDQPSQSHGAVRVLGVQDLLGLDFEHVFVLGLADTEFPRHYAEHPVLDDSARQVLNPAVRAVLGEKFATLLDRRLLGKPLLMAADRAREEPVLFFMALEAANRRCVLSYPTRTAEGEAIFPSMFVDEVLRHYRGVDGQTTVLTRLRPLPSVPLPSACLEPGELLRRAACGWLTTPVSEETEPLAGLDEMLRAEGILIERLQQWARIEAARKSYLLTAEAFDGYRGIDPAPFGDIGHALELGGRFLDPQRPWSPSMLEDAAACPFTFFAKHVLHLAPRQEPDHDTSPLVLSTLAQTILAEFFQAEPPANVPAARQRMRAIADRVFTKYSQAPELGHPGFWRVRQAELRAVLDDLAGYVAAQPRAEYRTHYQEHDLTAVVPCGPWSLGLKGRVDRVAIRRDAAGISGILVQDFKYSGNASRYRPQLTIDALGRSSFLLPVSLYLVLQQMACEDVQVGAAAELRIEYVLLKDATHRASEATVSRAFFEPDRPGGLADGIRRLAQQAIDGRFAPRPAAGKQTCTYCAYTALCRYWTSGAGAEASAQP